MLAHAPRQPPVSLIFDVRQKNMPTIAESARYTGKDTAEDFASGLYRDCTFFDWKPNSDVSDTSFVGCTFTKVDFYWAILYRAKFLSCTFEDVNFSGANLTETIFTKCRFSRCRFGRDSFGADTDLSTAQFIESPIESRNENGA